MKLKLMTVGIILFFSGFSSFSQSLDQYLISTSAATEKKEQISLTWSVGETITETFQGADYWLTQGFLQANLIVTSVQETEGLPYQVKAFPNPASDFVIVEFNGNSQTRLHYQLFDISGSLWAEGQIQSQQNRLSFAHLNPGVYFLKVMEKQLEVKTFKIIKQ